MKKCDSLNLKIELLDTICSVRDYNDIHSFKKETDTIYKAATIYASMENNEDQCIDSYMDSAMYSYYMMPNTDIRERLFIIYGMEYAIKCNLELSSKKITDNNIKDVYLSYRLNDLFDRIDIYINDNDRDSIESGFKMYTNDLKVNNRKK